MSEENFDSRNSLVALVEGVERAGTNRTVDVAGRSSWKALKRSKSTASIHPGQRLIRVYLMRGLLKGSEKRDVSIQWLEKL